MQNKHRSRAQRHFVFVVLDGLYLTPQNTYPTRVYVERRALSCYTCINRVAVTAAAESTLRPTAQRAHPTEARKKNFHHEPNKPHHAASAALALMAVRLLCTQLDICWWAGSFDGNIASYVGFLASSENHTLAPIN